MVIRAMEKTEVTANSGVGREVSSSGSTSRNEVQTQSCNTFIILRQMEGVGEWQGLTSGNWRECW